MSVAGARWQMSRVEVSLSALHVPAHPRLPGGSSGPFWRKDPSSCRTRPAPAAPSHAWAPEKGNRQSFVARGTTGWRRRRAWPCGECQGPSRWERGYIQAVGSLSSPTYLFIYFSNGSWEGLAAGAGRKGWEAEGEGERGGALPTPSLRRAGPERAAGGRLHCAPPALRVGVAAEAGVAMQRKARVAGRVGEQQGPSGSSFCRTRGGGQLGRALSRPRC